MYVWTSDGVCPLMFGRVNLKGYHIYFMMTFIDDYSGYVEAFFMKEKSETLKNLKYNNSRTIFKIIEIRFLALTIEKITYLKKFLLLKE